MIVAPILCGGIMRKMKVGKLCYLSFIAIGLVIFLMVPIPSKFMLSSTKSNLLPYILLMAASFMVGISATVANISLGTIFDQVTPVELMGRTSTIFNLAVTVFIPVGQMLFGFLYDIISPSYVVALSGIILILSVLKYKNNLL